MAHHGHDHHPESATRFAGRLRWERKGINYLALVKLGCALIAYQQATWF
jgi:hypothetical protein